MSRIFLGDPGLQCERRSVSGAGEASRERNDSRPVHLRDRYEQDLSIHIRRRSDPFGKGPVFSQRLILSSRLLSRQDLDE